MFVSRWFQAQSGRSLAALCLIAILPQVGCNSSTTPANPVQVQNVSVETSLAPNQNEWLNFSITLTTQKIMVAGVTLPILNPKDPTQQFGTLTLQPILCSTPANCPYGNSVTIGVGLDLTATTKAKGIAPLLPNGASLPVGGLQNSTIIALPVAKTGSVVYFAFGKGVAMFGTAVTFGEMNTVGQTIPGANLFIPVSINTPKGDLTILPGIFTGQAPNTSGIGFFADLSGIVSQSPLMSSLIRGGGMNLLSIDENTGKNELEFPVTLPSEKRRMKLYEQLLELNEKGSTLTLQ